MTTLLDCTPCAHARDHGWTGLARGSHCHDCHRTFTGGLHCTACHQHFASLDGFETHQTERDGCRSLGEVLYACKGPRFRPIEQFGGLTWKGTLHAEVCRNWSKCGMPAR